MATSEENIARIAEIKNQIQALTDEAVQLATEEKVQLNFGDMPFSEAYGAGSLRFTPDVDGVKDSWGYSADSEDRGIWRSSGSDYC